MREWSDWPDSAAGPDRFGARTPFDPGERYELRSHIADGAMGSVWRAWDREAQQEVALKALLAAGATGLRADEVQRLRDEFALGSTVAHPGLVALHEFAVSADGVPFFTMELVEGVDLLAWMRPDDVSAEWSPALAERVASAAAGLVEALEALHAAGLVHRDVKPQNVLVTPEGRVVVLDFGLASARVTQRWDPDRGKVLGTAVYMSAEQAAGMEASPASDWSAVGAVLFQAVTGVRPYRGTLSEVLAAKQDLPTPRPSLIDPAVPADVDALIAGLLHPWPGERPGPGAIVEVLAAAAGRPVPLRAPTRATAGDGQPAHGLEGRDDELGRLWDAEVRRRDGASPVVRVRAPSGMGKTALVTEFLDAVERTSRVVVLRGRCHPRVSVPYKAVDEIVGQLRRFLLTRSARGLASLRPTRPSALARLFPVLDGLWLDAEAPSDAEPAELRRQGFEALREVFDNVARRRGLVLWVDDLQWGDLDSLRLLRALLAGPDAPPVLLLLSHRAEDEPTAPPLQALGHGLLGVPVETVSLGPLGAPAVQRLVAGLIGRRGADVDTLGVRIAAESGGSPFFAVELTRSLLTARGYAPAGSGVDAVVQARLAPLADAARALLEVVCLAGGPLAQDAVVEAAGLGGDARPHLYGLQQASLVRVSAERARRVAPYHDRVREAVVAATPPDTRKAWHHALAETLSQRPGAEPEVLVEHWLGAGESARAVAQAEAAADRAAAALAFTRAAELYRLTLDLRGGEGDVSLYERLARSLELAGRGVDAGGWYVAAADALAAADPDAPLAALDLRRRAAVQFLRAGEVARGRALLDAVLGAFEIDAPRSATLAATRAIAGRAALLVRGFRFDLRAPQEVPPEALARLDALWGASTTLSMIDHTAADAFGVMHLREALAVGERSRVLRALAFEAAFEATVGGAWLQGRAARLLGQVDALAEASQDPYDRAWALATRGTVAWFGSDWAEATRCIFEARRRFQQECRGASWEAGVSTIYGLSALAVQGRLARLRTEAEAALLDARERGDRFVELGVLMGDPGITWILRDGGAATLVAVDAAIDRWPVEGFGTQRYHHLLVAGNAALFDGDGSEAWRRVDAAWADVERAQLLRIGVVGAKLRSLRGRAALATGRADVAQQEARKLARMSVSVAQVAAAALEVGLATGSVRAAALETLRTRADTAGLAMHRAVADAASEDGCARAEAWAAEEGVLDALPHLVRMLLPATSA